ncbi:MAG TPA: tRNA (adenosine(37)-N6)-dimethylallyltransferase MiaA [Desulfuromonadales bacterium]|nr:tRNA (adenosine(37)-N6)-dimethylallyltransferase MiaA [Desulfuromonadales bacterium]
MSLAPSCNLLVILGPTASGKTRLGVAAARRLGGEIISADSRQVFRGMDLGTGKDLVEYGEVPYHLIDILEPGNEFNVFAFQQRFFEVLAEIGARGRLPVLVGGTGLYLDAVLKGYRLVEVPENPALRAELANLSLQELSERLQRRRPKQHNTTDLLDRHRLNRAIEIAEGEAVAEEKLPPRPELRPVVFGLRWARAELRRRISARLQERLEQGLVEEVAQLHAGGIAWERLEFYGLEYRFIARHLKGELGHSAMVQKLESAIHDFAKRQETWFRRMERQGISIHWLEGAGEPLQELLEIIHALDGQPVIAPQGSGER